MKEADAMARELEKRVREAISDIAKKQIQDEVTDKIMSAIADELSAWAKEKENACEIMGSILSTKKDSPGFLSNQGKIFAYRDMWLKVTFDGIKVDKEAESKADRYWRDRLMDDQESSDGES